MHARGLWPMVVSALAACSVGTRVDTFAPARNPDGATLRLEIRAGAPLTMGELLAVEDTALLIRGDAGITLVPLRVIRRGSATAPGSRASFGRGRLTAPTRERLRLLSRYPQGVTPELLRQLLDAYGQAELKVLSA